MTECLYCYHSFPVRIFHNFNEILFHFSENALEEFHSLVCFVQIVIYLLRKKDLFYAVYIFATRSPQ